MGTLLSSPKNMEFSGWRWLPMYWCTTFWICRNSADSHPDNTWLLVSLQMLVSLSITNPNSGIRYTGNSRVPMLRQELVGSSRGLFITWGLTRSHLLNRSWVSTTSCVSCFSFSCCSSLLLMMMECLTEKNSTTRIGFFSRQQVYDSTCFILSQAAYSGACTPGQKQQIAFIRKVVQFSCAFFSRHSAFSPSPTCTNSKYSSIYGLWTIYCPQIFYAIAIGLNSISLLGSLSSISCLFRFSLAHSVHYIFELCSNRKKENFLGRWWNLKRQQNNQLALIRLVCSMNLSCDAVKQLSSESTSASILALTSPKFLFLSLFLLKYLRRAIMVRRSIFYTSSRKMHWKSLSSSEYSSLPIRDYELPRLNRNFISVDEMLDSCRSSLTFFTQVMQGISYFIRQYSRRQAIFRLGSMPSLVPLGGKNRGSSREKACSSLLKLRWLQIFKISQWCTGMFLATISFSIWFSMVLGIVPPLFPRMLFSRLVRV